MEFYVGLDVDPVAHQIAQAQINNVLQKDSGRSAADLQVHTHLKNFKSIKAVLQDIDGNHLIPGVQGILMDLGMSSMQVNNAERGFSVLCDGPLDMRMNPQMLNWGEFYGTMVKKAIGSLSKRKLSRLALTGGLHSTRELVDLIRSSTSWTRGGRQGWIKTATRVFQALRIAVNDELNILKDSIYSCFDCLASGGRLAVITFHSLEDRIVKQAFLDIINRGDDGRHLSNSTKLDSYKEKEAWIKQMVHGPNACILTKDRYHRLNVRRD
ncbi:hypothetical protein DH2020_034281 [Rehmannia glutinosa]|uniref:Ribosomal RNA small subunit methyltransferase H n=1 Tax=Rehmannia glutinosa TaxID=99300 RepID=A0ABR0VCM7_REHGL